MARPVEAPDERANAGAVEERHLRDVQHDVRFERQELVNHPCNSSASEPPTIFPPHVRTLT